MSIYIERFCFLSFFCTEFCFQFVSVSFSISFILIDSAETNSLFPAYCYCCYLTWLILSFCSCLNVYDLPFSSPIFNFYIREEIWTNYRWSLCSILWFYLHTEKNTHIISHFLPSKPNGHLFTLHRSTNTVIQSKIWWRSMICIRLIPPLNQIDPPLFPIIFSNDSCRHLTT